jgi:hypothetical protein
MRKPNAPDVLNTSKISTVDNTVSVANFNSGGFCRRTNTRKSNADKVNSSDYTA